MLPAEIAGPGGWAGPFGLPRTNSFSYGPPLCAGGTRCWFQVGARLRQAATALDAMSALQPFTPGVTSVQIVPEFDILLVLLPAKEHFFAADESREIEQPAVQVFHLDFASLKFN
jgi:hypothetical protein